MSQEQANLAFPIPNAVLEPYIKGAIATTIASALGDSAKLIEMVVERALADKVNNEGKRSEYSHENKYTIAEVVSRAAIQNIARETIAGLAEEMRPKIEAQIKERIRRQDSVIAKALVDGLIGSLKTSWSVKVEVGQS